MTREERKQAREERKQRKKLIRVLKQVSEDQRTYGKRNTAPVDNRLYELRRRGRPALVQRPLDTLTDAIMFAAGWAFIGFIVWIGVKSWIG